MAIPFSPPDIRQEDIDAVVAVLKSGWITTGPVGAQFESEIAEFIDADGAVLTSSATTAAESILRYLGIGPGDEVIVPAYTYTATASAALHVGATVKMVDVEEGTFFPSAERYLAEVNHKTKAIITVDLGGVPVDNSELVRALEGREDFAASNDVQAALGRVAVISDAAHSLGAVLGGKGIGQHCDFGSLSFHAVKNLTTAEGGAIFWRAVPGIDSEETRRLLRMGILHGQSKDALAKSQIGSWEYDILFPGYKANMPDVLAALGLSQLQRYPETLARRGEIVERYAEGVCHGGVSCLQHKGADWTSSCHLFLALLPEGEAANRNAIIDAMGADGVSANVHYKPLPLLTAYRDLGFKPEDFPNALSMYQRVISLPLHTLLTDEDVDFVISSFNNARERFQTK